MRNNRSQRSELSNGRKKSKASEIQEIRDGQDRAGPYREANRAESNDDFIHKIGIVEKEASESQYWLELFERRCFMCMS